MSGKPIMFTTFCEDVVRITLTPGQRVLALVAIDGIDPVELQGQERELAAKLWGDVDHFPTDARGVFVLCKGARIGGSYIFGALYLLWRMLVADLSPLAPGELAVALVVAPDLRLARQLLRYALGAARAVPAIEKLITATTADSFGIRRPDGALVSFECLPATRGGSAVRGRSLVAVTLTECAFFRDESAAVNDQDIFRAVAPRVLRGGMVVLESTPWTESGLLYEEYTRNFNAPTTAIAARAPTWLVARPTEIELATREAKRSPDNAAREFGAEFAAIGSSLFFGDALAGAVDDALQPVTQAPVAPWVVTIAADFGLVNDGSSCVAIHSNGREHLIADILEMRPTKKQPLKLSHVVAACSAFAAKHGARSIHVDGHVLQPAREHLPAGFMLKAVDGSGKGKEERFVRARDAFRERAVRIPRAFAHLVTQLATISSKPLPGGALQITLPRRVGSGHMDTAAALVVGLSAAAEVAALGGRGTSEPTVLHRSSFGHRISFMGDQGGDPLTALPDAYPRGGTGAGPRVLTRGRSAPWQW